jgi:hypothetical protein
MVAAGAARGIGGQAGDLAAVEAGRGNCTPASPGRMGTGRIGADLWAAAPLPGLRLADPLARHVADHERRPGEPDSISVRGCAVLLAGGLPGAACPASVQDLAGPAGNRRAGLGGHRGRPGHPARKGQHR